MSWSKCTLGLVRGRYQEPARRSTARVIGDGDAIQTSTHAGTECLKGSTMAPRSLQQAMPETHFVPHLMVDITDRRFAIDVVVSSPRPD